MVSVAIGGNINSRLIYFLPFITVHGKQVFVTAQRCELRTDADYHLPYDAATRNMTDNRNQPSSLLLTALKVGIISQCPNDTLHDVDLGSTKRWFGALNGVVSTSIIDGMSAKAVAMQKFVPSEFHRGPRAFHETGFWKAVEFKNFVLYWGMAIVDGMLNEDQNYHFRLLAISLRILESEEYKQYWPATKLMLEQYVNEFPNLYGARHMVCAMHKLLHLTDECEQFGPLYSFSSYAFESYIGAIQNLTLHSKVNSLAQINNRVLEMFQAFDILFPRDSITDKIFKNKNSPTHKVIYNGLTVTTEHKDSFLKLNDGRIVRVLYIAGDSWSTIKLTVSVLITTQYFNEPFNTSLIGIYKWKLDSYVGAMIPGVALSNIDRKYCALPTDVLPTDVLPTDALPTDVRHREFILLPLSYKEY
jgi:hypothetical protein